MPHPEKLYHATLCTPVIPLSCHTHTVTSRSTYSLQQLLDHAVPLSGGLVPGAVLVAGDGHQRVVELEDFGDLVQEVDAEALVPVVAGKLLGALLQHDVRVVLGGERRVILEGSGGDPHSRGEGGVS